MAKKSSKRKEKYEPKLSIKGSFEDVIKVSVATTPQVSKKPNPKKKK